MYEQRSQSAGGEPFEDLVSVRDAALLLRVSESTAWRWINEDLLPSYRVGRKRVYVRRTELARLLRERKGGEVAERERERLNLFPMSPQRRPGVDPVAQVLAFHARLHAKYGDQPGGSQAWEDNNEMREERSGGAK